jgi:hypothetical protein
MELRRHFRQNRVPVRVDDLEPKLVIGLGFCPVVRQLESERDPERCRVLLTPENRDASAEDERLALRDLGGVAEHGPVKLHGCGVYEAQVTAYLRQRRRPRRRAGPQRLLAGCWRMGMPPNR